MGDQESTEERPSSEPDLGPVDDLAAGDADAYGDDHGTHRRRPLLLRVTAGVVAVAVAVFLLGGVFRVLALPPLDFLAEALRLDGDEDVRQWQQAVVVVTARDGTPNGTRTGTGFNIRPSGLVVTNRHVVAGARWVEVRFRDGGTHLARDVRVDPAADLALLILDAEGLPTVSLAGPALPPAGTTVTVVGNPLGYPRVAMRGTIKGYVGTGPEPVMVVDAPIHRGHSGSPVFDGAGLVVGVVFAAASADDGGEHSGYAVPAAALHRLLASDPP